MRRIINGFLYDTDTSDLIYTNVNQKRRYYMTPKRGFFCLYVTGEMRVVDETTMKGILGERDINKYVEIFGEPCEG